MAMEPPFLLLSSLWLLSLQVATGCLQCDQRFLESVATLLAETLPEDVPEREALMERHIHALANLHGTFIRKEYERVLDVRGVMSLKSDILSHLRRIKNNSTWKGVFLWQLSMYQLRATLRNRMQQSLEKFADLGYPRVYRLSCVDDWTKALQGLDPSCVAFHRPIGMNDRKRLRRDFEALLVSGGTPTLQQTCSEDCTMTEGPILDCWTCLRIVVQCFDGELCGVEDRRLAEYNEVVVYIFLVCESVLVTSAVLIYLVCIRHKKMMLQQAFGEKL